MSESGVSEKVIGKALGIFQDSNKSNTAVGVGDNEMGLKDDELYYWALLKTLRADMKSEKLCTDYINITDPPGRCYWINSPAHSDQNFSKGTENSKLSLHEVDDVELAFSEITFSTTMFTDHSPHHYEHCLELLCSLI